MSQNVLILAPHTDDGEFGCGATIAKLVEAGDRVIYVAFSAAEQSVPTHLPRDILRTEVKEATAILGIRPADCFALDFEVRTFPEKRGQILDKMIQLNKEYAPKTVFLPSPSDTHQDHAVISQEAFRAFKRTTMLGYEVPWNNLTFTTSCFFHVEERHVASKVKSLARYKSQGHRNYSSEEFIRSLMLVRGTQIGSKYAEAFEVIRWVNP